MECSKQVFIFLICLLSDRVRGDEECKKDADCEMEQAVCTASMCTCPPDFVPNDVYTKCLQVTHNYGGNCTDSLQCSTSLKSGGCCVNGTCACLDGYHYLKGKCWKSLGLGDTCRKSENCWVSDDFEASICDNGICACSPGYYQREHSSCRRESQKPGDPCGIALDCKFDNAECSDRICQVKGSVQKSQISTMQNQEEDFPKISFIKGGNDLNLSQLVSLAVGEKCNSSADCPKNAICSSTGTCVCDQGYYSLNEASCHPELGSKCDVDADCLGKNTMCRDAKYCTCRQGYVTSKDGKYCDKQSRYLNWSCLRDEECSLFGPKSICLKKKCACDSETRYIEDQMFCWITKRTGETCLKDMDCGSGNVTCQNNACACLPGNHPSSHNDTCRLDSTKVGDKCVEPLDCVFPNATCSSSKECVCKDGYIRSGDKCKPGIGGECSTADNCTVDKSHCVNSKCACEAGYVSSTTFDACMLLTNTYQGRCQDGVQCSMLDADCLNGVCECRPGMHYAEGWKCYLNVELLNNCTMNGQCHEPHSYCRRGICTCIHGIHIYGNHTYCNSGNRSSFSLMAVYLTLFFILLMQ